MELCDGDLPESFGFLDKGDWTQLWYFSFTLIPSSYLEDGGNASIRSSHLGMNSPAAPPQKKTMTEPKDGKSLVP